MVARFDADRLQAQVAGARPPPRRDQQLVAPQLRALGKRKHVLAVLVTNGGGMLTETELHAVVFELVSKRLAHGPRFARQQMLHALDECHRDAHAREGLGHLHAHRASAQDQ